MGAVAVCGDIAEMFHRIRVREADASAQRLLWWNDENSILVYQLNVLTFGASCSPFISHYVRDKNAVNFASGNPKILQAITRQHYVDDYIDSMNTVSEAIEVALKVREVHAKGGFVMRNWSSNSNEVLQALGEKQYVENKTFECNEDVVKYEKILGLYWEPKGDVFRINMKFARIRRPIFDENIRPTKREILQVLMSVFDPLGFVACFLSYLKLILQHIWRSGLDWDETLNDELFRMWRNWLSFLPIIYGVSIPRCYSLNLPNEICDVELHTFVDASEEAYAAISYFRIECNGEVELKLIAAKSKVAPLKPIPRLELQAAVLGTRLTNTIYTHSINIRLKVMWTDSKTVLQWMTDDPRRYKQFVMFRIAEISKYTEISEWRWVPTSMNVADFATKFRPPTHNYNDWFNGPKWLKESECSWPKNTHTISPDTSEIRPRYGHIHTRKKIFLSINVDYFSSWFRLHRAVSNWVVLIDRLHMKIKGDKMPVVMSATHLKKAKAIILKEAPISCFPDEYLSLLHEKYSANNGAFHNLNVYIDNDGLVKVKNRAQYANEFCGYQNDPIILSGKHHLTRLIVMHYHLAYHHLNHETVLNEIRQVCFILNLRVLYKNVRRNCQS
ncbi:uncharacterized protein LOC142235448 [Haematobia irritans]|uniref:uncharacterized protein LOC142235448 n=1 Tax=Haematobia irritans TaxID=7368 RepID=UPI003F4FE4A0